MSHNGLISTQGPFDSFDPSEFPLGDDVPTGIVAPYWADSDLSSPNNVRGAAIYYREDDSDETCARATAEVRDEFGDEYPDFEATWTFVATWNKLSFFGNEAEDDIPVMLYTSTVAPNVKY